MIYALVVLIGVVRLKRGAFKCNRLDSVAVGGYIFSQSLELDVGW